MHSDETNPPLALKGTNQWSKFLSSKNSQSANIVNSNDEGGLELGQVVASLQRRIILIAGITVAVSSLAFFKGITSTPTYQAKFEILTKPVTVETQVLSSVPQTLSSKEQAAPSDKGLDQTKLKLLTSPKLLDPIVKQLKSRYPTLTYEELLGSLAITQVPNSEILVVSYQNENAAQVKDVLNLIDDAYLNYSLEERLADANQGIKFVEAQLPLLRNRVEVLQLQLQTFRQQYNLVDPEVQGKQLSDQLGIFNREKLDNQVKLQQARTVLADLQQQFADLPTEEVSETELNSNPRYQKLKDKILEVDSQIATESGLFLDQSNTIKILQEQRSNLLPLLAREGQRVQAELASQIRALEARDRVLVDTENFLNGRVKQLSVISRQYTDIQRELKIATDNLDQFLTKREALRIDAGQRQTPWQLLSPPGAPFPSSTNVKRAVFLGAVLGVLLGVGAALLVDKLDQVIYSVEEVKTITKLPLLGVTLWIPSNSTEEAILPLDQLKQLVEKARQQINLVNLVAPKPDQSSLYYVNSPALEVFRSIYTNIRLISPDAPIQSLVITSPTPQDGKSTIALNLAQAAAAMTRRVLLVDADLRRPQLHERLNLQNHKGLTELIAADLSFQDVVQQSQQESNLFVITAGATPPDSIRVISSQKMQSLMQQFEEAFDLVIYDTPPLVGLADASLVAANTSGMILVARLGKTNRSDLIKAMDLLKIPPTLVIGTIANHSEGTNPGQPLNY